MKYLSHTGHFKWKYTQRSRFTLLPNLILVSDFQIYQRTGRDKSKVKSEFHIFTQQQLLFKVKSWLIHYGLFC